MTNAHGTNILPFYVVIDVSYSMAGEKLEQANRILPDLVDTLAKNPILSDKVRIGVITFADDARVELPLCDPLDENLVIPALRVREGTSYSSAFRLLRLEIEANVSQLKADGFAVHRPAIFFVTDGQPLESADEVSAAFRELTGYDSHTGRGFSLYPNLIPFGIDGADSEVLASLIYPKSGAKAMKMYLTSEGGDASRALESITEVMISSILASGQSISAGSSGIILPPKDDLPNGIQAFDADDFV